MRPTRTIAIAGAGIGGLTAAIAVARSGFRVVVVERSATQPDAGAGIQVTPNAFHLLEDFRVAERLRPYASRPEAIEVRAGRSGRRIATLPLGPAFARRYGAPYLVLRRADLTGALAEAAREQGDIDILYGAELTAFAVHANGVTVMTQGAAGHTEFRASALIAADGVRSVIRAQMPGGGALSHAGRTAWRAVIPEADAPPGIPADRTGLWLGARAHLVHYPIRAGAELNLVAIVADERDSPGWSTPGDRRWLMERFAGWAPRARALLAAPAEWMRWPVLTVRPNGSWAEGPVALLGDAAHAMSPHLAQGGAMAIEDAAVLGRCLAESPAAPEAALKEYERRRKPRVQRAWRAATEQGDLYQLAGPAALLRNAGMGMLGGRLLIGRYDWLYGWKPG